MTASEWNKVFNGDGDGDRAVIVNGEHTKVRYVVADGINSRARQVHKARPDKAGVLYKIEAYGE
jgi:hypothetical protein